MASGVQFGQPCEWWWLSPTEASKSRGSEGLSFEHVEWNWLRDVCVSSGPRTCESEVRRGSWPRKTGCRVVRVGTAARWAWMCMWTGWPKGSL